MWLTKPIMRYNTCYTCLDSYLKVYQLESYIVLLSNVKVFYPLANSYKLWNSLL